MNRFIWGFAAIALAIIAIVGFLLLQPTAERANYPRPSERPLGDTDHVRELPPAGVEH